MKISKEIRIVALECYIPKESLSEKLETFEREKKPLSLILTPNKYDSTCLLAKIGKESIGVVNLDDKRYVMQLLNNGIAYDCLRFLESYKKENESSILRYVAWIDLEKVDPILAGEEWANWEYELPVIESIANWNSVDYTAGLLERTLMENENDMATIDELVNDLTLYTPFDISVETTKAYENLSTMLEINSTEKKREWKHKLQHASTIRRSKRMHEEMFNDWWNMCLASPEAKNLRDKFESRIKAKYGITSIVTPNESFKEELKLLIQNLQHLPYGLYNDIDSLSELYHKAFYTNIPRNNLKEIMSALILKDWLERMDETHDKGGNTYYYVGRDYIHNGDKIECGGTKIEKSIDN